MRNTSVGDASSVSGSVRIFTSAGSAPFPSFLCRLLFLRTRKVLAVEEGGFLGSISQLFTSSFSSGANGLQSSSSFPVIGNMGPEKSVSLSLSCRVYSLFLRKGDLVVSGIPYNHPPAVCVPPTNTWSSVKRLSCCSHIREAKRL